jgi:hypothetical protein
VPSFKAPALAPPPVAPLAIPAEMPKRHAIPTPWAGGISWVTCHDYDWNGLVMCLGDRNMKDHGRIKTYKQRQCEKETSMWDSGYYMVLHLFHHYGAMVWSNWWGHELGLALTCGETNPWRLFVFQVTWGFYWETIQ